MCLSSPRVHRSGSFIGISFVFSTGLDEENDAFKFHNTKKKLKKREEHINVPSVSIARTNASSSFVLFEGEKGALMVCKRFKMLSRERLNVVRFEKRLFFKANAFSFETPHVIYACALNATV